MCEHHTARPARASHARGQTASKPLTNSCSAHGSRRRVGTMATREKSSTSGSRLNSPRLSRHADLAQVGRELGADPSGLRDTDAGVRFQHPGARGFGTSADRGGGGCCLFQWCRRIRKRPTGASSSTSMSWSKKGSRPRMPRLGSRGKNNKAAVMVPGLLPLAASEFSPYTVDNNTRYAGWRCRCQWRCRWLRWWGRWLRWRGRWGRWRRWSGASWRVSPKVVWGCVVGMAIDGFSGLSEWVAQLLAHFFSL